jgi:hypothetical protein
VRIYDHAEEHRLREEVAEWKRLVDAERQKTFDAKAALTEARQVLREACRVIQERHKDTCGYRRYGGTCDQGCGKQPVLALIDATIEAVEEQDQLP